MSDSEESYASGDEQDVNNEVSKLSTTLNDLTKPIRNQYRTSTDWHLSFDR